MFDQYETYEKVKAMALNAECWSRYNRLKVFDPRESQNLHIRITSLFSDICDFGLHAMQINQEEGHHVTSIMNGNATRPPMGSMRG